MTQKIARRLHRENNGFTLIELMVVVLIIGILIAIALPTFLGVRSRAQDKQVQSSLRNAFTTARTSYTDASGKYDSFTTAAAAAIEPALQFVSTIAAVTAAASPNTVGIVQASGQNLLMVGLSNSGEYFGFADVANSGTVYCKSATAPTWSTVANCSGGW